jgi:hypothetical protein
MKQKLTQGDIFRLVCENDEMYGEFCKELEKRRIYTSNGLRVGGKVVGIQKYNLEKNRVAQIIYASTMKKNIQ